MVRFRFLLTAVILFAISCFLLLLLMAQDDRPLSMLSYDAHHEKGRGTLELQCLTKGANN